MKHNWKQGGQEYARCGERRDTRNDNSECSPNKKVKKGQRQ